MSGLTVSVDLPGRLRADLSLASGEAVAVVGPNGSGKTTLLGSIAGGTGPAHVGWRGEDWTRRPAYQRRVGLLPQDHQLFPHLSVLANVAFGPRARGARRRDAHRTARAWLTRLDLGAYAGRRPHELSGGQAQRVALARALATDPDVLLLDEPFAALDVAVAAGLRDDLRALSGELLADGGLVLFATHDAPDLHRWATRVLVLDDGAVVQDDSPAAVAEAPATPHAGRLLGLNLLPASAVVTPTAAPVGALATFRPSAVTLASAEPTGSARNRWAGRIRSAVERDGVVRVHLEVPPDDELYADVTRSAADEQHLTPGRQVWASVKATDIRVFPSTTSTPR